MVQSSKKLRVDLLVHKYIVGLTFLRSSIHSKGSPTWSSIVHAKNVLKDGYSWCTGSGSSSFWFSTWSPVGPLEALVPYVDIQDLQLTMKDVLSSISPHSPIS
ncbi:hypothetical protein L195_g001106 [Trifolium pratense]|uniref:Uncharacterized protein n=1 Tax=Trifolium pratense TaxID=57577 RepID=A0A2K3NNT5_TRIPR|nr:hypothetical protein L195_g001106 [Trifolium pratense]